MSIHHFPGTAGLILVAIAVVLAMGCVAPQQEILATP